MAKKQTPKTETLPAALLKITESSGIAITEAQGIGFKFAPFMQKVNEISMQIEAIERDNPTPEDAALARRLRLNLVENRGIKGLATVHKDLKAESLIRGRLIDSFRNVVDQTSEMSELIAVRIENHSERMEAERQLQLSNDRKLLLEPYDTDTAWLPLGKMTDEQFGKILANEKLLFEAKKAELERLEAVRIAQEVEAERLRAEQIRLDNERKEAERLENERVKNELAEKEALLQKEREAARIQAEKLAKENAAKLAEQQRIAEVERKKQFEILAKQQEAAKVEREKQLAELAKQQEIARKAQAELQTKKDAENKVLADKKAALLAPDKEKVNQLFLAIKTLEIPVFSTLECQAIGEYVKNNLSQLLDDIKFKAKKLQ